MIGSNRAQQYTNLVRSLHEQGILDRHFDYVENIRNQGNPLFLTQTVDTFFLESEEEIEKLTRYLSEAVINFKKVDHTAHQLKGCCASIGGCRVVLACLELREACDNNNKEWCASSFESVKQEYNILRDNLNQICEMERAHLAKEARRGQR